MTKDTDDKRSFANTIGPYSARAAQNTDRELWREREGDFYADSIHVTQDGKIGMNCGGYVIVMPIRRWHEIAKVYFGTNKEGR